MKDKKLHMNEVNKYKNKNTITVTDVSPDDSASVPRHALDSPKLCRTASLPDDLCIYPDTPKEHSTIATLRPFVTPGGGHAQPSRKGKTSKQKNIKKSTDQATGRGPSVKEVLPGLFEPVDYAKYLVIKTINGQTVFDLDIFEIQRSIISATGRRPKVSHQRDGSILVEASSPEESQRLRSLSSLPESEVVCTPHNTFNQTKGIIFSHELLKYSEEKLLDEFSSQIIVKVERFKKKN